MEGLLKLCRQCVFDYRSIRTSCFEQIKSHPSAQRCCNYLTLLANFSLFNILFNNKSVAHIAVFFRCLLFLFAFIATVATVKYNLRESEPDIVNLSLSHTHTFVIMKIFK